MAIYASSAAVVNASLSLIASQTLITSLTDGTSAANAANVVYAATVQLMLRAMEPDFARAQVVLTNSGLTPLQPWAYEYLYPDDALRILQVKPPVGSYDPLRPDPVRWSIESDLLSLVQKKVILTNQASALAVYITSLVPEPQWDSMFSDAVVRRLANPLAMSIAGRPDFARELLDEAGRVAASADAADESMVRV